MRTKEKALGTPEGGWAESALPSMLVTELTSQLERSELKEEAEWNTAREERVRQRQRARKQGQESDRTAVHVGDAAHIPPREVPIEVGALVEDCVRQHPREKSEAKRSDKRCWIGDARPH
eukprot:COSAG04_NODE_610_length_12023_cov_33.280023_8_plen_120_part_00